MPFKSQAQRRKFAQLLVEGKISNETFEEWNRETGGKKLPERMTQKKASTRTTAATKGSRKRAARKTAARKPAANTSTKAARPATRRRKAARPKRQS